MKRILAILMTVVLIFTFVGCGDSSSSSGSGSGDYGGGETTPTQTPIVCDIKFAKTVDEKYQALEWYEGDEFEINTKIYVIVDFTLINYGAEDDFVEFKIQIPYAKYYSTHEYEKGIIAPKEEYKDVMSDDGTVEPMVELSEMVFNVKAGQTPFHYTYCFAIEANQVCEDVQFKAVFISDAGIVIARNQTFTKTYSFVSNEGGAE